jgi:4-oxalomesaconate tautomerase
MLKIPCTLYRGGTSKGPFFLKSDLPEEASERDKVLLRLMGSPHLRQIDGIGGGNSLTSKAAIISKSQRDDADIDYLLCQIHINDSIVETTLNCGNMLSAVAPFAIEKGLVKATHPETVVRIYNENTGILMHSTVQTPNGLVRYEGDTVIDGVPGTASSIKLSFLNAVGSKTKKLLPTGNVTDEINGIHVSCADVAVPMVIVSAKAMGKTGYETKAELDADIPFLKQLESIRKVAAAKMGLGDVSTSISPKICLVAPPRNQGAITSRYFTPFDCHSSHAVSGALCLAAACLIDGTIANVTSAFLNKSTSHSEVAITIEHPSGNILTVINMQRNGANIDFPTASFIRTARPLFEGNVVVPNLVSTTKPNMLSKL